MPRRRRSPRSAPSRFAATSPTAPRSPPAPRAARSTFHLAAHLGTWGRREDFIAGNVDGTKNALAGSRDGRRRALRPLRNRGGADGRRAAGRASTRRPRFAPTRRRSTPATKAMAEQAALGANGDGLETVVVRPRFVWGAGDTTLLPGMVELVESGKFAWIGGGRHLTDVTHVDNVVEGLLLGAREGRGGEAYFVTDGEPVVFREFVGELLETQGVEAPKRSIPDLRRRRTLRRLRGGLAPAAARWRAAAPALRLLGLLAGVHDRDRQGPPRARLRAGQVARPRASPSSAGEPAPLAALADGRRARASRGAVRLHRRPPSRPRATHSSSTPGPGGVAGVDERLEVDGRRRREARRRGDPDGRRRRRPAAIAGSGGRQRRFELSGRELARLSGLLEAADLEGAAELECRGGLRRLLRLHGRLRWSRTAEVDDLSLPGAPPAFQELVTELARLSA